MVETRSVGDGLKHQNEKRSMDHFAGLDVSVKETSVCIVDDTGRIVREVRVASEPDALLAVLTNPAHHFMRTRTGSRAAIDQILRRGELTLLFKLGRRLI
jgi:hypothetical protein